jgi:membrane AbrB-like protein
MIARLATAPAPVRTLVAYGVGGLAGWLAQAIHLPLPWMIGPLLVCAALNIAGGRLAALPVVRNFGQWGIGTALGMYFTADTLLRLAQHGVALGASLLFALGLGFGFAWALHRFAGIDPTTAFFAGAVGGASEMAVQGELHGASTATIAAVHSVRIALVVLVVPFAYQSLGLQGQDAYSALRAGVEWDGIGWLVAATMAGGFVLRRLALPNAWMIGPLLVTIVLTASGRLPSGLPGWVLNAAQLGIGVALGSRFAPGFFGSAPRLMRVVVLSTLGGLVAAAVFGVLLAKLSGLAPATMVLATVPGGLSEMSLTAKLLKLGVPIVTSFQIMRVLLILLALGGLYRVIARRFGWPIDVHAAQAATVNRGDDDD